MTPAPWIKDYVINLLKPSYVNIELCYKSTDTRHMDIELCYKSTETSYVDKELCYKPTNTSYADLEFVFINLLTPATWI